MWQGRGQGQGAEPEAGAGPETWAGPETGAGPSAPDCAVCAGAVQFTYDQRMEFGLTEHGSKDDAINALRRIHYMSGGTATGAAIRYTSQHLFR